MKGILIDPFTEKVLEVALTGEAKLAEFYLLLECNTIDVISIPPRLLIEHSKDALNTMHNDPNSKFKNNSLYLDDEGLYKDDQRFYNFIGTNLAGRGLILGFDPATGDSVSTKLSVEDVRPLVEWEEEDAVIRRQLQLENLNEGGRTDYH